MAAGPCEQFEWAMACARAPLPLGKLRLVTVRRTGKLAAVSPMAVKTVYGVRRRVMLGVDRFQEPMDLVAADAEARAQLIETLASWRRPMIFGRLPAESPASRL